MAVVCHHLCARGFGSGSLPRQSTSSLPAPDTAYVVVRAHARTDACMRSHRHTQAACSKSEWEVVMGSSVSQRRNEAGVADTGLGYLCLL